MGIPRPTPADGGNSALQSGRSTYSARYMSLALRCNMDFDVLTAKLRSAIV